MSEPTEREDWESLLGGPGWLRFQQFAKEQWGPAALGRRMKLAVLKAQESKTDPAVAVLMVDAAQDAVSELLSYPKSRIQDLLAMEDRRKAALDPPVSRRGLL
jgi:hypothetical protein